MRPPTTTEGSWPRLRLLPRLGAAAPATPPAASGTLPGGVSVIRGSSGDALGRFGNRDRSCFGHWRTSQVILAMRFGQNKKAPSLVARALSCCLAFRGACRVKQLPAFKQRRRPSLSAGRPWVLLDPAYRATRPRLGLISAFY